MDTSEIRLMHAVCINIFFNHEAKFENYARMMLSILSIFSKDKQENYSTRSPFFAQPSVFQ